MRAPLLLTCLLWATEALAEPPLLTARSRVDDSHLSLLGGPSGAGVGLYLATRAEERVHTTGALGAELFYTPADGVVELRGSRQWRLTGEGLFAASAQLGLTGYGVVRGPVDVGVGPHVGLFAGLGGTRFEALLGAQAGAELFARTGGPRVPLRAVLGLRTRLGEWGLTLTARGGADVERGRSPTLRGDVLLALGWYGAPLGATSR